jgi:hypothetical protein
VQNYSKFIICNKCKESDERINALNDSKL